MNLITKNKGPQIIELLKIKIYGSIIGNMREVIQSFILLIKMMISVDINLL